MQRIIRVDRCKQPHDPPTAGLDDMTTTAQTIADTINAASDDIDWHPLLIGVARYLDHVDEPICVESLQLLGHGLDSAEMMMAELEMSMPSILGQDGSASALMAGFHLLMVRDIREPNPPLAWTKAVARGIASGLYKENPFFPDPEMSGI